MRMLGIARVPHDLHRRHTRIERKAGRRERVQCPQRATVDRPLGSTVSPWVRPAGGSHRATALLEIPREILPCQLIHPAMQMAMRSHFVSSLDDRVDDERMTGGNPSEDEKCSSNVTCV